MRFPCTGCGACCRVINRYERILEREDDTNPYYFPYQWDETGRCENLNDDNKCRIYETRPLICNVEAFTRALDLPLQEFYEINIGTCHELIDEFKLGEEMKPRIEIQGSV
jgi:Fe-S-cluster containining protein